MALPHGRKKVFRFTAAARIRPGMHAILIAPDLLHEQYRSTSLAETFWIELAAASTEPIWVLDETERLVAVNAAARIRWATPPLPLHQPITEAATVHWPKADEPPVALIEGIEPHPLRARILHGPTPGWRVLLFTTHRNPSRRRTTDTVSAPEKHTRFPFPDGTTGCCDTGGLHPVAFPVRRRRHRHAQWRRRGLTMARPASRYARRGNRHSTPS
ncbi:hypothetical protein [Hydrogenophilus thermoluteolus]|uniref:hypothetical protein n=1 Tax=Hydrogenophilus thermoluteolus TaxID=297 RepID=UPI003F66A029